MKLSGGNRSLRQFSDNSDAENCLKFLCDSGVSSSVSRAAMELVYDAIMIASDSTYCQPLSPSIIQLKDDLEHRLPRRFDEMSTAPEMAEFIVPGNTEEEFRAMNTMLQDGEAEPALPEAPDTPPPSTHYSNVEVDAETISATASGLVSAFMSTLSQSYTNEYGVLVTPQAILSSPDPATYLFGWDAAVDMWHGVVDTFMRDPHPVSRNMPLNGHSEGFWAAIVDGVGEQGVTNMIECLFLLSTTMVHRLVATVSATPTPTLAAAPPHPPSCLSFEVWISDIATAIIWLGNVQADVRRNVAVGKSVTKPTLDLVRDSISILLVGALALARLGGHDLDGWEAMDAAASVLFVASDTAANALLAALVGIRPTDEEGLDFIVSQLQHVISTVSPQGMLMSYWGLGGALVPHLHDLVSVDLLPIYSSLFPASRQSIIADIQTYMTQWSNPGPPNGPHTAPHPPATIPLCVGQDLAISCLAGILTFIEPDAGDALLGRLVGLCLGNSGNVRLAPSLLFGVLAAQTSLPACDQDTHTGCLAIRLHELVSHLVTAEEWVRTIFKTSQSSLSPATISSAVHAAHPSDARGGLCLVCVQFRRATSQACGGDVSPHHPGLGGVGPGLTPVQRRASATFRDLVGPFVGGTVDLLGGLGAGDDDDGEVRVVPARTGRRR